MEITNKAFCQYASEKFDDSGIEGLKLYLPTDGGYINFNIVHSVMESSKCDTWRLSAVYYCDENFERIMPLTRSGAEWEMALKIKGRPDFIGGYAHGDEICEKFEFQVDGKPQSFLNLRDLLAFDTLTAEIWSRGYDPNDSVSEALRHYKKITVEKWGVSVEQRVEWLQSYELENSYMAMMPPFKSVTDHYYTTVEPDKIPINMAETVVKSGEANGLFLCGESGFTFGMTVEKYLTDKEGRNTFIISDNGGVPYNKMYFVLCHGGKVEKSDVFETRTVYTVKRN